LADRFPLSQEVYLAIVLEVLQSIRQAEIAQMLSRIYSAPGGTEALDVLMKYMYVHALTYTAFPFCGMPNARRSYFHKFPLTLWPCSYKGMAQASPASSARNITPQATGFSQVHSRGGGEGGGQAMSVLLSWHEKVRD
jgi:actin related protein 2/3 complex subunit 5